MQMLKLKVCSKRRDCPCVKCYETRISKQLSKQQNKKVALKDNLKWKVEWCYTYNEKRKSKVILEVLPILLKLPKSKWVSTIEVLKHVETIGSKSLSKTSNVRWEVAVGNTHFWKLI